MDAVEILSQINGLGVPYGRYINGDGYGDGDGGPWGNGYGDGGWGWGNGISPEYPTP